MRRGGLFNRRGQEGGISPFVIGLVILLIVALVILVIIFVSNSGDRQSAYDGTEDAGGGVRPEDESLPAGSTVQPNRVFITSSGFSPSTITILKNQAVEFVNQDPDLHRPASDLHPTHTVYPGSNINKCGTGEEIKIFDSCNGLASGESWLFFFDAGTGTWGYHDHLNPSLQGTVVVQE